MAAQVARAVEIVEYSRQTHVDWATWIERATLCCDDCRADVEREIPIAGDLEHHRECISGYDLVLATLRGEPVEL